MVRPLPKPTMSAVNGQGAGSGGTVTWTPSLAKASTDVFATRAKMVRALADCVAKKFVGIVDGSPVRRLRRTRYSSSCDWLSTEPVGGLAALGSFTPAAQRIAWCTN